MQTIQTEELLGRLSGQSYLYPHDFSLDPECEVESAQKLEHWLISHRPRTVGMQSTAEQTNGPMATFEASARLLRRVGGTRPWNSGSSRLRIEPGRKP